jgi:hypothetical protein
VAKSPDILPKFQLPRSSLDLSGEFPRNATGFYHSQVSRSSHRPQLLPPNYHGNDTQMRNEAHGHHLNKGIAIAGMNQPRLYGEYERHPDQIPKDVDQDQRFRRDGPVRV